MTGEDTELFTTTPQPFSEFTSSDENPYGYITTYQSVTMVIFLICGVIGNALVVTVIIKKKDMRNSINCLLINLAIADLLLLVTFIPPLQLKYYGPTDVQSKALGIFDCQVIPVFRETAFDVSSALILAITVDRFYAVYRPLSAIYNLTMTRGLIVSLVLWLLTGLVNLPLAYLYRFTSNECVSRFEEARDVLFFVRLFVFYFIPFGIALVLYVLIIAKLLQNRDGLTAPDESCSAKERKQVVYMVGVVVLCYFLLLFPIRLFVLLIYLKVNLLSIMGEAVFRNVMAVAMLSACLNSTINPVIYNFMSKRFRTSFLEVLGLGKFCFKRKLSTEMSNPSSVESHRF